ncbi:uncharacterized protein LOC143238689 [Tachypleus tridentatus]|uniref:uncharacterized protein LOC143238689 n=1 Tax=Tachypleus tridentatus TaxID=6853 RepID=UPI003FD4141C
MGIVSAENVHMAGLLSICLATVGLGLVIGGGVLTGIAYTEVPPPFDDPNYDRYKGSNPKRIVGPIMMVFGALLMLSGCIYFAYALWISSRKMKKAYSVSGEPKSVTIPLT